MAKTRLFGKLRRIVASVLAERPSRPRGSDVGRFHLTRRQLTWGSAQLAAAGALSACAGQGDEKRPGSERVAVVGAGIAGLHCAYRLQQSGVDVSLYEASGRVGGRMFTARDDAYDDQVFELGGELIDSNHAALIALAKELDITLDDRLDPEIQPDVWFVAGAEVPEATIVEQFTAVAPTMADAVAAADNEDDDTAFNELDRSALSDWLAENVPPETYPELHAILTCAYRGEFGLETERQSALNLLYLIGSDEPDPFRIFGESDERYHAREGSDAFATRLAAKLNDGVLSLNLKLTALSGGDDRGYKLLLTDTKSGSKSEVHADHVVLALPYSILRKLELSVPLSDLKRQIIDELGYGTNAKVMGQFDSRVWREELQKSGTVTSDLALQQLWDSSMGQPGKRGILTNFLGGDAGVDVGAGEPEDYYATILPDVERVFPGTQGAYRTGSARRMHWPSYEFSEGSYTCYLPGQWSFWGHEGEREGNVHFCGEHTSADFQGWMEGGAETGAFAAKEVLDDLGRAPSKELAKILKAKGRS
ncbi:MAG TPA: NAD(P)/FAD-dependent oxidoreductase [Polyangiaceae bacterium]|nr:NAD(P)/FAD-dependent oxidoreductase [Polyangiaceae bacterium]